MVVGKEGGECEIFFALLLGQRYFEIKYLLPLHRQWRSSGSRHTYIYGVLAHLARARHWQCRGERFESAILHAGWGMHCIPCLHNTARRTAVIGLMLYRTTLSTGGSSEDSACEI